MKHKWEKPLLIELDIVYTNTGSGSNVTEMEHWYNIEPESRKWQYWESFENTGLPNS